MYGEGLHLLWSEKTGWSGGFPRLSCCCCRVHLEEYWDQTMGEGNMSSLLCSTSRGAQGLGSPGELSETCGQSYQSRYLLPFHVPPPSPFLTCFLGWHGEGGRKSRVWAWALFPCCMLSKGKKRLKLMQVKSNGAQTGTSMAGNSSCV